MRVMSGHASFTDFINWGTKKTTKISLDYQKQFSKKGVCELYIFFLSQMIKLFDLIHLNASKIQIIIINYLNFTTFCLLTV